MTLEDYIQVLTARRDLYDRQIVIEHTPADAPAEALQLTDVDPAGPVWIEIN